jgi:hypothetical protein
MLLAIRIAIIAWLLTLFLPWWTVAFSGLIFGAVLGKTGWHSFLWGFAGIGGLWLFQTLYIHIANDGILTTRIAELFSLPSPLFIILVTVLIGGVIGGLTTLTGYLFRKMLS